MKIIKWIGRMNSAINGIAHIQVEPNETADIEEMLKLIDGDSAGHFGVSAHLVSADEQGFGFNRASVLKTQTRIYKCHVSRD